MRSRRRLFTYARLSPREGEEKERASNGRRVCEGVRARERKKGRKEGKKERRKERISVRTRFDDDASETIIYLRGVIFPTPSSPPSPRLSRNERGGHNGLHTLSHRDDTVRMYTWTFKRRSKREKGYVTYGDLCKIART